jgi:hypothetical protein
MNEGDGTFRVCDFGISSEMEAFSFRNQSTLDLFDKFNVILNDVLGQISPKNYEELIVSMLGRICARHHNAILLLCSNGFGFDSMRILRSMFEKVVDAYYLDKNPGETDDFFDFYILQLKKIGLDDIADQAMGNNQSILDKFKHRSRPNQTRMNWSKKSLKQKAEAVGVDDFLLNFAYNIPNLFVHSSMKEILSSLIYEENGSVTPVEGKSSQEDTFIDLSFHLSGHLMVEMLKLQIARFNLPPQPALDEYVREIDEAMKSSPMV